MGAIFLVRHGQASFGAAEYDELSPLGARQSRVLGAALQARGLTPLRVVCGQMRRHRQTADACLTALGCSLPVEIDAGWNEYDHQELLHVHEPRYREPRALAEDLARGEDPARAFQAIFVAAVARWVGGAHDGDYRESWPRFCERVDGALARLAGALRKSESALVFTSGGPIARLCGERLHVPAERQLELAWTNPNASVSKLITRGGVVHVSTLHEHAHFEGGAEARTLLTYR